MFKQKIIHKWEAALAMGLVVTIMLSFCSFSLECEKIKKDVLRLHILANSDSVADQALKLKIRDRILKDTAIVFDKACDIKAATAQAKAHIGDMQKSAEDEIAKQGFSYPVTVTVAMSHFDTRHYDNITLPAGDYMAVRVLIGKAAGHNWWCVMYPGLCVPAASADNYDRALDENEQDVVENYPKYEIKFKSIEIIEQIKQYIS